MYKIFAHFSIGYVPTISLESESGIDFTRFEIGMYKIWNLPITR